MATLSERLAKLERAAPRAPRGRILPKFENVASGDIYALQLALEGGYWKNLLARREFALMVIGERITAAEGPAMANLCREVMATEQPKSKPWARPK